MKNKLSKILNNKLIILTFLISSVVISIIYKLNNVTPFGTNSLLCVDFYHQYGPMLGELYDRIHSFEGLTYSFNMAAGLPFFRNFLNYLSSPFNIIIFLFPRQHLVTSYSFIIGLKAVFSSVTMVYYLSKKFNNKNLYLIPMGIIYAFSAYFSAYYWNIMWLDGMVFLPLITLGIESIVNNKKWKLYTISLAIMLIANYFIGYMICIYSVVYFIIYHIYKTSINFKDFKKSIINTLKEFFKISAIFAFSSLLAGCLSAFLLLPMASSMASISATGGVIPKTQYYAFELVDYLKYHFTGVSTTVFASDNITAPNISCGILSIALILVYLINLEIPFKNKVCYLLILGFFIFAFFNPALDYILHAFHVPNDLPYRYSFLYSFILVTISTYGLINIKKIKYIIVVLCYLLIMSTLLYMTTSSWSGLSNNMIYINMILLTLYFIFYTAIKYMNGFYTLYYSAIIVVAVIDVIVSINYNWDITQVLSTFYQDYDSTKELLQYVDNQDNELFYRIENTSMMTLNDPSWYDYYGLTTFSSMAYESMAKLQHHLGIPGNEINSYYYVQSTPIYDLMFDIKYFIGDTNDEKRYTKIKKLDETANRFDYNIGLIFGANNTLKDWTYTSSNPFINQNSFIESSTGISDVFTPSVLLHTDEIYQDETVTILKYEYLNTFDNMYLYTNDYGVDYFIVGESLYYKNDTYSTTTSYSEELTYSYLESYDEEKIINISSEEDVITFYVAYNSFYDEALKIYDINHDRFTEAYLYLNKYKFDMKKFNESKIEGNITVDKDMIAYTSIPYDEGWKVYIDGKRIETRVLGDSLLSFDLSEGSHKVTLKYEIPYFKIGACISLISLLIFGSISNKDKIMKYLKRKKKLKN